MKKKHVIALALCVLLIGGAAALVHLFFPKARPIRCPDSGGVISMTVGKNASKGDIPVDEGDWEELLLLLPRLIGHAGDERTVTIRIVSIEDDWATAEVIRDDAPFFARLPHEIVFDTNMLGSMAAGLETGERYQAMYLYGAARSRQVKVVSVLKEEAPLTYSGFGEE